MIATTLGEICQQEHVEAEPEALQIVARRASGSLRDAQSLLDRLLASGSPLLTVEVVNGLLGTASDERLLAMIEALADHDAAAALRLLEQSAGEGVQPAEILSGIIDFTRDALVLAVGAESMLLSVSPRQRPHVERIVERWTIDSILAALQILSECRARMRGSLHGRLLVELALVRIARLEDLTELGTLVERLAALESGSGPRREGLISRSRQRNQAPPEAVARHRPSRRRRRSTRPPAQSADRPVTPGSISRDSTAVSAAPPVAPRRRRRSAIEQSRGALAVIPRGTRASADADGESWTSATANDGRDRSRSANQRTRSSSGRLVAAGSRCRTESLAGPVQEGRCAAGVHLSQVEPVSVIGPDVLVIAANAGIQFSCGRVWDRRIPGENRTGSPAVDSPVGDREVRAVRRGRRRGFRRQNTSTHGGKMPWHPTRWFNG